MPIRLKTDSRMGSVSLPPSSLISSKEIRAALLGHEQARTALNVAFAEHTKLEAGRAGAQAADSALYADNLIAGKRTDPGTPAMDKLEAEISAAARRLAASRIVVERAFTELERVLAEHGAEWHSEATAAVEKTTERVGDALDGLTAACAALAEQKSVLRFTSSTDPVRWNAGGPGQVTLARGDSMAVTDVVSALRTALTQPVAPAAPQMIVGGLRVVGEQAA